MAKYEYFYGNKVSKYGLDNGYVDYACMAKAFDAVLNNEIIRCTSDIGYWENVTPDYYETDDGDIEYFDIYQYYIVSSNAVEILREAGEIIYYNDALNMYVWAVTHYGTSWDYVLTSIPCDR